VLQIDGMFDHQSISDSPVQELKNHMFEDSSIQNLSQLQELTLSQQAKAAVSVEDIEDLIIAQVKLEQRKRRILA
jgi:hypothetical protein